MTDYDTSIQYKISKITKIGYSGQLFWFGISFVIKEVGQKLKIYHKKGDVKRPFFSTPL